MLPQALPRSELDPDRLYAMFAHSYLSATGKSQTREWFEEHVRRWELYGTRFGMVAIRHQGMGVIKLSAVAGEPLGILKGLDDVLALERPVWSAVSKKLLPAVRRIGFRTPPPLLVRLVLPLARKGLTSGRLGRSYRDGSFQVSFPNVGSVRKYFIGNREFWAWLRREAPFDFTDTRRPIGSRLKQGVTLALRRPSRNGTGA